MQRWHLAFFPWVNSGSIFFAPPLFTKAPKWLFLCLCRETNWSGCKWKELLFIHKQGASSQDPSQLVSLQYSGWDQNAKQSPWAFHQSAAFVRLWSPQGLLPCSSSFYILGCLVVFSHMNKEFTGEKKKKKQSQNLIPAEKHGKSNHSSSTKPLVKCQQETVQRCSSLCLQRPTQAQVLQGVHLYTEKGPGLQPSLQALSILKDSAAPFTTILVQGTSLS